MLKCRWNALVAAMLLSSLMTAGPRAQDRFSVQLSIAGIQIGPALQPRIVIDRLSDGDEARITLLAVADEPSSPGIVEGQPVDIIATAPDGTSARLFHGVVSRISQGSRDMQTTVEIVALGPAEPTSNRVPQILAAGQGGTLLAFAPMLSATSSVQAVVVKGWDAAGAPVIGRALAPTVPIGNASADRFGRTLEIQTDRIFATQGEADAYAHTALVEALQDRISGEAVIEGGPDLGLGSFVEIEGLDVEFDGEYYVAGVSHRIGSDSYGGFSTTLRVRRSDLGMFRLPAIDDEVLVAFDHGDVNQPYRIDSWWDCDSRPRRETGGDDQCRLLRWPW